MKIDVTHHERRTDIDSAELHAEYWHDEQALYFAVDLSGLDVEAARRVAKFILKAAGELERFKKERSDEANG